MTLLEVSLELTHELLLDVQHSTAHLADGMVMITAGELVVGGALTEVGGVDGARCCESFQRSVDGAARETRLALVKLCGDLIRRAMAAQADDGVVDHRPLGGTAHARGEHQACLKSAKRAPGGYDSQRPIRFGEEPAARSLDHNVVLDADAAPARDVDARLDGEDHAGLEHRGRARVKARIFVCLEAEAMPDSVEEPI